MGSDHIENIEENLEQLFDRRPLPDGWDEEWIIVDHSPKAKRREDTEAPDIESILIAEARDTSTLPPATRLEVEDRLNLEAGIYSPKVSDELRTTLERLRNTFDGSFLGALESSGGSFMVPPDAFAFYLPWHYFPANILGIYLVADGVQALANEIFRTANGELTYEVSWRIAWIFLFHHEHPVIVLSGEQGSAKSTFSAILRALLDPNTAPLRALPREDRDLFIAASNGHVLAFDNVSGLPPWISDTLCRLATGGGFAVRQLYTDQDEVLFDAARPVILNGIEDIVTRPDLADRAVFLTLEPIPEERRRPEAELWAAFNAERPRILGVLLDAVAHGLERLPHTTLERLPRMADFDGLRDGSVA